MGAVRPAVDESLHDFLSTTTFAAKDFFERSHGSVRITRGLAQRLAETATLRRHAVGPVVEWLATKLLESTPRGQRGASKDPHIGLPTRLTEANRSAGRVT